MTRSIILIFVSYLIAACSHTAAPDRTEALPPPSLEKIAAGVWIHKSYENVGAWGAVLSQGLVIETDEGVALVDTAWNDEDTFRLLDDIEALTGELPDIAIITHAHRDKMGGLGALQQRRIGGRAHPLTNEDAPARGLKQTQFAILDGTDRQTLFGVTEGGVAGGNVETDGPITVFYPGPGHTRDNIVVYYAPAKILFAGCLIRPGGSDSLGNTDDGDIAHWAEAVRNVAEAFPEAQTVIPSHGPPGGRELFDHTIALAGAASAQ